MSGKVIVGLIIGAIIACGGAGLACQGRILATHRNSLGNGQYTGGIVDAARQDLFQTMGLVVLGFGLILLALCFARWLFESPTDVPEHLA
jgi:hypothetical protein